MILTSVTQKLDLTILAASPARSNAREPSSSTPLRAMNRRVRRLAACLALWVFLAHMLSASPQEITVRLINVKSGKPLREVPVTMFSWNGPPTFQPDNVPKSKVAVHAITDAEGRAVFHLPEPLPEHVGFDVGGPMDFRGCWHRDAFPPETVLRSGIVAKYYESKCGKLKAQVSAKPGEVVIYERKLTKWDQMRREIP